MTLKNSAIIWQGLSPFNSKPIVAIMTGLSKPSNNVKTGPMLQVWIIPSDTHPHDARQQDQMRSVCGNCPHQQGACYVGGHTLGSIYKAFRKGKIPAIDAVNQGRLRQALRRHQIRWGAFGDPAFLPPELIRKFNALTKNPTKNAAYTHQWHNNHMSEYVRRNFQDIAMASCDTPQEQKQAVLEGWRTFRVRLNNELLLSGEIVCPADSKVYPETIRQCDLCGLCNGKTNAADKRKNIVVVVHGNGSKHYKTFRKNQSAFNV